MTTYDKLLHDGVRIADTDCDRWLFSLSDFNGGSGWRISRQAHSPRPGSWIVSGYINPGVSQENQYQNEMYPVQIVYKWQPLYVGWSGNLVCI